MSVPEPSELEKLRATIGLERIERHHLQAKRDAALQIIDLYFSPWGAAKAAKWEALSGDREFSAENALRLVQRRLKGEP